MVAMGFDLAKVDSANFIPSLSSSYILLESSAVDPKSLSADCMIDMVRGIGGLIFGFWVLPKDFVEMLFRSLLEESIGPEMMSLRFEVGKVDLLQPMNFLNRGRRVESEAAVMPRAFSTQDHAARVTVLL
jgi:hypothetical protein